MVPQNPLRFVLLLSSAIPYPALNSSDKSFTWGACQGAKNTLFSASLFRPPLHSTPAARHPMETICFTSIRAESLAITTPKTAATAGGTSDDIGVCLEIRTVGNRTVTLPIVPYHEGSDVVWDEEQLEECDIPWDGAGALPTVEFTFYRCAGMAPSAPRFFIGCAECQIRKKAIDEGGETKVMLGARRGKQLEAHLLSFGTLGTVAFVVDLLENDDESGGDDDDASPTAPNGTADKVPVPAAGGGQVPTSSNVEAASAKPPALLAPAVSSPLIISQSLVKSQTVAIVPEAKPQAEPTPARMPPSGANGTPPAPVPPPLPKPSVAPSGASSTPTLAQLSSAAVIIRIQSASCLLSPHGEQECDPVAVLKSVSDFGIVTEVGRTTMAFHTLHPRWDKVFSVPMSQLEDVRRLDVHVVDGAHDDAFLGWATVLEDFVTPTGAEKVVTVSLQARPGDRSDIDFLRSHEASSFGTLVCSVLVGDNPSSKSGASFRRSSLTEKDRPSFAKIAAAAAIAAGSNKKAPPDASAPPSAMSSTPSTPIGSTRAAHLRHSPRATSKDSPNGTTKKGTGASDAPRGHQLSVSIVSVATGEPTGAMTSVTVETVPAAGETTASQTSTRAVCNVDGFCAFQHQPVSFLCDSNVAQLITVRVTEGTATSGETKTALTLSQFTKKRKGVTVSVPRSATGDADADDCVQVTLLVHVTTSDDPSARGAGVGDRGDLIRLCVISASNLPVSAATADQAHRVFAIVRFVAIDEEQEFRTPSVVCTAGNPRWYFDLPPCAVSRMSNATIAVFTEDQDGFDEIVGTVHVSATLQAPPESVLFSDLPLKSRLSAADSSSVGHVTVSVSRHQESALVSKHGTVEPMVTEVTVVSATDVAAPPETTVYARVRLAGSAASGAKTTSCAPIANLSWTNEALHLTSNGVPSSVVVTLWGVSSHGGEAQFLGQQVIADYFHASGKVAGVSADNKVLNLPLKPRSDADFYLDDLETLNASPTGFGRVNVVLRVMSLSEFETRTRKLLKQRGIGYSWQLQIVEGAALRSRGPFSVKITAGDATQSSQMEEGWCPKFRCNMSFALHYDTEMAKIELYSHAAAPADAPHQQVGSGDLKKKKALPNSVGKLVAFVSMPVHAPLAATGRTDTQAAWLSLSTTIFPSSNGTATSSSAHPPSSDAQADLPKLLLRWRTTRSDVPTELHPGQDSAGPPPSFYTSETEAAKVVAQSVARDELGTLRAELQAMRRVLEDCTPGVAGRPTMSTPPTHAVRHAVSPYAPEMPATGAAPLPPTSGEVGAFCPSLAIVLHRLQLTAEARVSVCLVVNGLQPATVERVVAPLAAAMPQLGGFVSVPPGRTEVFFQGAPLSVIDASRQLVADLVRASYGTAPGSAWCTLLEVQGVIPVLQRGFSVDLDSGRADMMFARCAEVDVASGNVWFYETKEMRAVGTPHVRYVDERA